MTHSAYLLSTVVLAAAAAFHLQDARSGMDRSHPDTIPKAVHSTFYKSPSFASPPPVQTIGSSEVKSVHRPQQWVF